MDLYMYLWLAPIAAVLGALIHLALASKACEKGGRLGIVLMHFLFWGVGLGSIYRFIITTFQPMAGRVAGSLGFATGSPFQDLVGWGALALGVIGVLCLFYRGGFWLATATAALVVGWTTFISFTLHHVPSGVWWMSLFYGGVGSSIVFLLALAHTCCCKACDCCCPKCPWRGCKLGSRQQ